MYPFCDKGLHNFRIEYWVNLFNPASVKPEANIMTAVLFKYIKWLIAFIDFYRSWILHQLHVTHTGINASLTYRLIYKPLTHRLDTGLSAGVGILCQAGYPQYAHALSGVVDVWGGRISGWNNQWGRTGSPVYNIWAGRYSLHGNASQCFPFHELHIHCRS